MRDYSLWHQIPETPSPPTPETPFPPTPEDVSDSPTLKRIPAFPEQITSVPIEEDVPGADSLDLHRGPQAALSHRSQRKKARQTAVIALLLLLIVGGIIGIVLISRQNTALAG